MNSKFHTELIMRKNYFKFSVLSLLTSYIHTDQSFNFTRITLHGLKTKQHLIYLILVLDKIKYLT